MCEKDASGKLRRQDVTVIHSDSHCFLPEKGLLRGTDTEKTPEQIIPEALEVD